MNVLLMSDEEFAAFYETRISNFQGQQTRLLKNKKKKTKNNKRKLKKKTNENQYR